MLNYVAMVWNRIHPAQDRFARHALREFMVRSPGWDVIVEEPGFALCCQNPNRTGVDKVYLLHGKQGVVLGRLFERNYEAGSVPRQIILDERQSEQLVSTHGRALIRSYWGRYVAFIRDQKSGRTWVIRDPSGGVPCYAARTSELDVYFIRAEDYLRLSGDLPSIDHRYLVGQVAFTNPSSRLTGLRGVSALLAGECAQHTESGRSLTFYWNPLELAKNDIVEDEIEAARLTRSVVRACVHAWACCFDKLVHGLSGGLDSSIVLSCLRDLPRRLDIICETIYCKDATNDDERVYARLCARELGVRLLETRHSEDCRFQVPQNLPRTCEPFYLGSCQFAGVQKLGSPLPTESVGLFSGHGGDELFFVCGIAPTATDYLYYHRLNRLALGIMVGDAIADGASLWRVMRHALQFGLLRNSWSLLEKEIEQQRRLHRAPGDTVSEVTWEEAIADKEIFHPLYTGINSGIPPCKIFHCSLISALTNKRHSPLLELESRGLIPIDPLISQPLIELSLRIPTYLLRCGGVDRSVARRAFSCDLPRAIIQRRSKGGGNREMQAAVIRNIHIIRERMLDGQLVQRGYLDRAKLERALCLGVPDRIATSPLRLLRHFITEVWYSNWTTLRSPLEVGA